MSRTYTKEEFILAVKTSTSIRQVLNKLGLRECGGNYQSFHNYIKELKLDTSHFTGMLWNKGKITGPKRPIDDYLSNKQTISSHNLKTRLLKEGYFTNMCYSCKLTDWLDSPIPLELHHIDGNHDNNNLSNLTILCPNCHAQTDSYRGKAKKDITQKKSRHKKQKFCKCGSVIYRKSSQCVRCHNITTSQQIPDKDSLIKILSNYHSISSIAKYYSVSKTTIIRWFKRHDIIYKNYLQ